jgi:enoyl-CoA hydratase/carnithine racemase
MTDKNVRFASDGRTGHVIFDRPAQGNRVNVATMRDFISSLQEAHEASVDVLVIEANGDDFSLGRDQDEKPTGMSKRDNLALILDANDLLGNFQGVTVAKIRGRALGFGSGLATQCDITLASDLAQFGFTEIQHGFAPSIVMTYLETFVSRKAAVDLLMTGRQINATEARELGMVTRVVRDEELDGAVDATVTSLLDKPIGALRQCKFFLRDIGRVPEADRPAAALDALTAND